MKNVILATITIFAFLSSMNSRDVLEEKIDSEIVHASVIYHQDIQKYEVVIGTYDESAPAFGKYTIKMEKTGWDTLAISTYQGNDNKYTDQVKSYAMGYLEGVLTWKRIWNHYQNLKYDNFYGQTKELSMPDNIKAYLIQNREWIKEMSLENKATDPFWYQADLIYIQFEGLVDGYNSVASDEKKISMLDANLVNVPDVDELFVYKNRSARPKFKQMSLREIENIVEDHTSCSSLIKVAPDYSDVWFGHATSGRFAWMTRIFKEYRFKSQKDLTPYVVAMSSYPGSISSIDEFYITDKDLFVTATTNYIFRKDLYDLLTPKSVLTWHRILIAHRLADNGKTWTEVFARYASGTINDQIQVLDLKKIDTTKRTIDDGALWIIEQIPGYTKKVDVTNYLRKGYFPSYNCPFSENIRVKSGYYDEIRREPELKNTLDYHSCARANIFRRDHAKIVSLEGIKKLLRYNNYQTEPLSKRNPYYTVAGRKDLDKDSPECRGTIDGKVASIKDIKGRAKKIISLIAGPTADNQEPFKPFNARCFLEHKEKYLFQGFPAIFNYKWIEYETTLFNH